MTSGTVPTTPVSCGTQLVVYASHAKTVEDCAGYGAAGNGNNDVCVEAERLARSSVQNVTCDAVCPNEAWPIIYKGWSCGGNPKPIVATCAVEIELLCWGMY